MFRPIRFTAVIAALLAVVSVGRADTIARKHDKPLAGDIKAMSKTDVTIEIKTPKTEQVKVPSNEVQSIDWQGEPAETRLARSDEAGGRYQKSLEGFQKAVAAIKSSNPLAKTDLEYAVTRVSAKLALADASKIDEAVTKLEDFTKRQSDHYRYYEAVLLLGQLYTAKKDFVKARQSFDNLARAPWKDYQMASKVAIGRMLQADGKFDEAGAAFDAVLAQPAESPLEESQRQEAMLGKTKILIAQKRFDDGEKLLGEIIDKTPAEDGKVMAEAYVRLGDCLREQGKDKDAVLAYLRVDVIPHLAAERALHAESLFHLTRLWEKVGQKGRAALARDKLESDYPSSEWTKQLKAPAATTGDAG